MGRQIEELSDFDARIELRILGAKLRLRVQAEILANRAHRDIQIAAHYARRAIHRPPKESTMNTYRIAEELSAAHGCIDMLKRAAWPAECAEAERHQSNLRALCGQLLTGSSLDAMHAARTIADAACCIGDTLRPSRPSFARAEADTHAERLHELARQLAGPRVGELYDDDAGLDEVRDWYAQFSNTQAAGLLPVEPAEVFSPHTLVIDERAAA